MKRSKNGWRNEELLHPPKPPLTTIFYFIMNRLHMLLKDAFLSCLIVTKLATIFNSIMDRLHMLLKTQNLQLCSYIMKSILGGLSKECQNDLKLLLNVIIDKKPLILGVFIYVYS